MRNPIMFSYTEADKSGTFNAAELEKSLVKLGGMIDKIAPWVNASG